MERGAQAGTVMERAGRIVLAAVFIYAGVAKGLDPAAFAGAIDGYRLLPHPAGAALASYLPWIEIAAGLGVLWPRLRLGAFSLLFFLCLVFGIAIASAWIRGLDITCGCFGGGAAAPPPCAAASCAASCWRSSPVSCCGWRKRGARAAGCPRARIALTGRSPWRELKARKLCLWRRGVFDGAAPTAARRGANAIPILEHPRKAHSPRVAQDARPGPRGHDRTAAASGDVR